MSYRGPALLRSASVADEWLRHAVPSALREAERAATAANAISAVRQVRLWTAYVREGLVSEAFFAALNEQYDVAASGYAPCAIRRSLIRSSCLSCGMFVYTCTRSRLLTETRTPPCSSCSSPCRLSAFLPLRRALVCSGALLARLLMLGITAPLTPAATLSLRPPASVAAIDDARDVDLFVLP